jgi:two-component system phosphate regulon sensor histidine kinase PhoR
MNITSRSITLILGGSVALVVGAFLYLVPAAGFGIILISSAVAFAATALFSFIALEFLIFREVEKIYSILGRLKEGSNLPSSKSKLDFNHPFRSINKELFSFASLKQREIEDLKKMEAFRREFVADVSHELKTPIFNAQGYIHTLLDGAVEDKAVRNKFLRRAAKSLDRLDRLVQDLLTLSKLETGAIKMNMEPFDIKEVALEVLDQMEDKAERKQISPKFGQPYLAPIMVMGDQQRIYQVLLNLLSNSIKYSKEGATVTIDFEIGKSDVTVAVKDTGRGIPPEDLKRIFERFYRVEKSRSKEMGGTGLGLAIVKHIIEAHHSKVSVTSALGKGSVFSFKLKKALEPEQAVPKTTQVFAQTAPLAPVKTE